MATYGVTVTIERHNGPETTECYSLDDVKRANERAGYHFFSPDTLRFFSSRVHETLYYGGFFVTSEQDRGGYSYAGGPRLYTVRKVNADASVETVGEFGGYASRNGAHGAAARLGARARSMANHPSNG